MYHYTVRIEIAGGSMYDLARCETLHAALAIIESLLSDRSDGPNRIEIVRGKKID
jgi:hypothetical protein